MTLDSLPKPFADTFKARIMIGVMERNSLLAEIHGMTHEGNPTGCGTIWKAVRDLDKPIPQA